MAVSSILALFFVIQIFEGPEQPPKGAYHIFSKIKGAELRAKEDKKTKKGFGEISSILSAEWKEMDQDEKSKWETKKNEAWEAFREKLAEWEKKYPEKAAEYAAVQGATVKKQKTKAAGKPKKKPPAVPLAARKPRDRRTHPNEDEVEDGFFGDPESGF